VTSGGLALAKLLGCNLTDFGTSLVDVRSTGLRRYAKIFQRSNEEPQLSIKVACVTERDELRKQASGFQAAPHERVDHQDVTRETGLSQTERRFWKNRRPRKRYQSRPDQAVGQQSQLSVQQYRQRIRRVAEGTD